MKKIIRLLLFAGLLGVLVINIMNMPAILSVDAPSYNDSIDHYLDHGVEETGATSIISAILADYRSFDTLGETIVLFTAIIALLSVSKVEDLPRKEG